MARMDPREIFYPSMSAEAPRLSPDSRGSNGIWSHMTLLDIVHFCLALIQEETLEIINYLTC
jgi:hypothetical protein